VNAAGGRFDDATLATLEFSDVKEQIAAHSTCEPGAAALRSLRPDRERSEARADLALVDDAVSFFDAGQDFGFGGVVDVADSLERAEVGGVLSGSELRDVARSERALAQAALAIHSVDDVARRAQLGEGAADLGSGRPYGRPLIDRRDLCSHSPPNAARPIRSSAVLKRPSTPTAWSPMPHRPNSRACAVSSAR
jgi:dsDNA-specific endonuclease/ATPase MutS2